MNSPRHRLSARVLTLVLSTLAPASLGQPAGGSGGVDPPVTEIPEKYRKTPDKLPPKPIGEDTSPRPRDGKSVNLRAIFKVGEPLRYRMTQKARTTHSGTAADPGRTSELNQEIDLSFIPTKVDAETGQSTVDIIFDRAGAPSRPNTPGRESTDPIVTPGRRNLEPRIIAPSEIKPAAKTPAPAQPESPQVDADEDSLFGGMLDMLVGTKMTMVIDRAGNIVSISGGESLDITAMMGLGASSLGKSAFGQIVSLRPGNPTASIGETWTTASDLGSSPLGAVGMKTNWTVDNVARGIADIRFAGTLASKSEAGGLLKITDLTYGGKAAWDSERGRLKRMDSKMTMTAELPIEGTPSKIQSTSTTTFQLID
jgi:hypothetical protein